MKNSQLLAGRSSGTFIAFKVDRIQIHQSIPLLRIHEDQIHVVATCCRLNNHAAFVPVEWSENSPNGSAYLHIFRKTGLQLALSGEHAKIDVARDASITPAVMATSYAQEFDEELWHKSNRTYRRIRASLPLDVAVRYG